MSRSLNLSSLLPATSRRALPALASSCLGALLVTGCLDSDMPREAASGDDPLTLVAVASSPASTLPPKPALAQLVTATGATRQRFMDAALGADVSDVFGSTVGLALHRPACPAIERRGSTLWSTPDCTDDAGLHWSGRLVAHTWDDERPMVIQLERWSVDAPGTRDDKAYEGTVTVHPDGRFEANLVAYKDGLVSRTYAKWAVDSGKVIADVDSYVIVQDHGIAQIGGAWRVPRDERATGLLVLSGAQELTLDLDASDATCAPIAIDDKPVAKRCDLPALADALAAFSLL